MTKMKITHHRFIEDGCIHLMNYLLISQCCISVWKKMFANGEIMFRFKRIGIPKITFGLVVSINMNTYVLERKLCHCFVGQSLFTKKIFSMERNIMFWSCLWSLHTLEIPAIYSRFNEHLAVQGDDKFGSLMVCNICLGTVIK